MSIYDGHCTNCGIIEIRKGMHDPFPICCPTCGGELSRRFSAVPVTYNAPGFAAYDHELRRHTSPERYEQFLKEKETIIANHKRRGWTSDAR